MSLVLLLSLSEFLKFWIQFVQKSNHSQVASDLGHFGVVCDCELFGVVCDCELLKHRLVDTNAEDNAGNTAIILACEKGHLKVVCELAIETREHQSE